MNTSERAQVRNSLLTQGFDRTNFTDDISGVGDYTETWTHSDGTVMEIKWAARTDIESGSTAQADETPVRSQRGAPEAFAPYRDREITVTVHHTDGHEIMTGYPYDSWRFSPSAVGLRVHFAKDNVAAGGDYIVLPDDTRWTVTPTDGGKGYEHIPQAVAPPAEPVVDAPGMYDETDMGIDLPASDEEDTIPSGFTGNQVNPETLRPVLRQRVSITCVQAGALRTSISGYPVEAWRFSTDILAVEMVADLDDSKANTFLLPDDSEWQIIPTGRPHDTLHHRGVWARR